MIRMRGEILDFSSLACDSIKSKRFDFFSNRLEKEGTGNV